MLGIFEREGRGEDGCGSRRRRANDFCRNRLVRLVFIGVGATAVAILAALPATAQSPRVTLAWTAPPECPRSGDVVSGVDALLRNAPPVTPSTGPLNASGTVTQSPDGEYRLSLRLEGEASTDHRSFVNRECTTLADAAALVLALAIDPESVARAIPESTELPESTEAPEPTESVESPVDPVTEGLREQRDAQRDPPAVDPSAEALTGPPEARPAAPPPNSVGSPARFGIAAWALGDLGAMPGAAIGVGLGASYGGLFAVDVLAGWFPERFAALDGSEEVGGRLTLLIAQVGASWWPVEMASAGRLGLRGALEGGLYTGTGEGVTVARSVTVGAMRVALELVGRFVVVTPLELEVRIGGHLGLFRPQFELDEVGVVHSPAPLGARLSVGVGAGF
jgi:hypothetical protein